MAPDHAYVAHILAQTRANVDFLVAHNHLSDADAEMILNRLPSANAASTPPVEEMRDLSVSASGRRAVPPPPPRSAAALRARALWAYNEDESEPNDLSFSAGETVEIVDETNADWWTGRCRGRQGLFPSNYVEKLDTSASVPPMPTAQPAYQPAYAPPAPAPYMAPAPYAPGPPAAYGASPPPSDKPVYRPFGAVYAGQDQPPSTIGAVNSVGLQQDPGQQKKKNKFGGLGNTMANSAAGGVGFGAGAAIGSGIVNSIF